MMIIMKRKNTRIRSMHRKMMKGHWVVYDLLRQQVEKDERYIWFHAASLGEFEQGRPLIESIRERYPDYKILQTFFSPSGYEVRKNYRGADIVCYLPFDKPRNVKKFLDIVNPCMAFFIKYEFWKNYLDELHKRRIPVYSVSSILFISFRTGNLKVYHMQYFLRCSGITNDIITGIRAGLLQECFIG